MKSSGNFVVLVIEARLSAHVREECRQVPLEADPLHQAAHVGVQARDLAQADLVDLRRGQLRGGVVLQQEVVVGRAVRQLPGAVVVGRGLAVLDGPGDHGIEGRLDGSEERQLSACQQRFTPRLVDRKRVHLGAEVCEQRAVTGAIAEWPPGDDVAGVLDHVRKHEARRQDAEAGCGRRPLNALVHVGAHAFESPDIGIRVLLRLDAVRVDQERGQRDVCAVLVEDV
jgi:hypothetical protein